METQNPQILHIRLPKGMIFTENQLLEFSEINQKKVESMMQDGFFTLIYHLMGNYGKAARFTREIITELTIWNRKKRLGEVYPETMTFRVDEHSYREGDTSFVAFKKASKKEQLVWLESSANKAATLLLEMSSTKINAKIDIKKTIEYWIPFGTDYVIVVNLEDRKWYFFDCSANYTTHDFSEKFIGNSNLPDLVLDFEEIARECGF